QHVDDVGDRGAPRRPDTRPRPHSPCLRRHGLDGEEGDPARTAGAACAVLATVTLGSPRYPVEEHYVSAEGDPMGKLVVTAGLASLAILFTAAPAPAADNSFDGQCHVTGTTVFGQPIGGQPQPDTYTFTSTPGKSTCDGTLNG